MDNSDRWVEKYGESFMDFPLKGLKFKKTAWTKKNNHTHCLFCGDEITNEEYNYHTEKQGYASTTKFWWSCPECFEVFTQKYNLPVVKNTVKDIELALSQFKTVVISLENKQYFIKNTDGKITVEHNGVRKSYDSILSMEREQLFYGKVLREIIDDIFVGFVASALNSEIILSTSGLGVSYNFLSSAALRLISRSVFLFNFISQYFKVFLA